MATPPPLSERMREFFKSLWVLDDVGDGYGDVDGGDGDGDVDG